MITRMSELFLRTLRDDPADAEVPSHKLLIRAGYIRPIGPGLYSWLPLGLRVLRKIETGRPRRNECHWRTRDSVSRAAAQGAVRGDQPLDRVRRRRLPASGPAQERLPAGPDPRRAVHADGQGGVQQLQGFPVAVVPDPDEVPRRGPAARRHPARPRVPHEGLVFVRRRRRGAGGRLPAAPRRIPADLRHARCPLRHRLRGVRGHGRQRVGGIPGRKRNRRGHLRAVPGIGICRQRRGGGHRRAGVAADRGAARGQGVRHAGHPDDRHPRRLGQHAPWTARSPPPTR